MLRLPGKTPLPAAAAGRLEKADCCRLLQVPGAAAGERHAFLCPSLTSLNGVTLALSLPQERTELGRGLVRGLWFDQPLTLWLCGAGTTLRARAWAYRCHSAGPVFTRLLARAREADPVGDIACAWELLAEEWRETGELPPAPELLPDGPPELHLDHPLLHTDR